MSRLLHALDAGSVSLPDNGVIAVVEPPADFDLSFLPKDRVIVITPNYPAFAAFEAAGYVVDVVQPAGAALSIVVAGRSKSRTQGNIATAALAGSPIIVDGDKTAGVDSLHKALRKLASVSDAHSKAHGKVFSLAPSDALLDWLQGPKEVEGFHTWPGVFSEDKVDPGSRLLADLLPPIKGRVGDLGSGWGYLAQRVLAVNPAVTELLLVEADAHAGSCGRENVKDPRAVHRWDDATTFDPYEPLDVVVTNPPFHIGRAPDATLGQAFIQSAHRVLKPSGALWLVANRQLPYESVLRDCFREVDEISDDKAFKIFHARKPHRR